MLRLIELWLNHSIRKEQKRYNRAVMQALREGTLTEQQRQEAIRFNTWMVRQDLRYLTRRR